MRTICKVLLPALSASMLLAACGGYGKSSSSGNRYSGSSSTAGGSSTTVNTASNSKLGHMVLVDSQGLTLYHLSVETGGKFICTGSCVGVWHPLTASPGARLSGDAGSLSLVKRPEGTSQIAYKGMPLYTFAQDKGPGEANGQGIKDVGTWTAVTVAGAMASAGSPASSGSGGSTGGAGGSTGGSGGVTGY